MNDERGLIMRIFQISKFKSRVGRGLARASALAAVLLSAVSASTGYAQTCPYCYANAAAQTPGMLQTLRTGILVMLLPCLTIFVIIFSVAYRRRESFNAESVGDGEAGSAEQI